MTTEWMRYGRCKETDPEAFYPERDTPQGFSPKPAKRICSRCEVREVCLRFALATKQQFGIWGGTAPVERERILAAGRIPQQKNPADGVVLVGGQ